MAVEAGDNGTGQNVCNGIEEPLFLRFPFVPGLDIQVEHTRFVSISVSAALRSVTSIAVAKRRWPSVVSKAGFTHLKYPSIPATHSICNMCPVIEDDTAQTGQFYGTLAILQRQPSRGNQVRLGTGKRSSRPEMLYSSELWRPSAGVEWSQKDACSRIHTDLRNISRCRS